MQTLTPKAEWDARARKFKAETDSEHDEVVALGGLHISAPSGTIPGASITSFADAPAARAIPAARASISRCRTI